MALPSTIVFVHGWSVTHTDTYGGLPQRLAAEAAMRGRPLALRDLRLARYVSFHDEVRVDDVARGMEAAVRRELADLIARGERFAVLTHSTGGPVARAWWWNHYAARRARETCPMSHLVMLAPANFGSALAQLGKGRISRLKSWLGGVEPGAGILDWLEHGSREAWELNEAWIRGRFPPPAEGGARCFVLTGQRVDRSLYDHLNSYTGESGGDGVVRAAAANLNASLVRLEQGDGAQAGALRPRGRARRAPRTAFRLIAGAAHSGAAMGILRSVAAEPDGAGGETVATILRCLEVGDDRAYGRLCDDFDTESAAVQRAEQVEIQRIPILPDRVHLHDRCSLVLFRVTDDAGRPLEDFDLELAGANDDPGLLPQGFFKDRQRNRRSGHVLSYFFDHDRMIGAGAVADPRSPGALLREASPGVDRLGLRIRPRPDAGFAHYRDAAIAASPRLLRAFLRPNETTLVDVVLRRAVHRGVFELGRGDEPRAGFQDVQPGGETSA